MENNNESVQLLLDNLPKILPLDTYMADPPQMSDELIEGVLRIGHKMIISGSSKAGKSCLLMELCVSIAEGIAWLGLKCRKGRVLYVNLEIDEASAVNRFLKIYDALGIAPEDRHLEAIDIWNLRGYALPLIDLVPALIHNAVDKNYDAIIIDPIYKIIMGDENSATDMGRFCNQFDKICAQLGCAVVYGHHHSKGDQGQKRAMDRASGSGVFARDPDAQLDIIQLSLSDVTKHNYSESATAWRMETNLREFPNIKPFEFWFDYPIHYVDSDGQLSDLSAQGRGGQAKDRKAHSENKAVSDIHKAYDALNGKSEMTVKDFADYLSVSDKTIYAKVKNTNGEFILKSGKVVKPDKAS